MNEEMISVDAEWSGEWPCLCNGEWTLIVNGKNVSQKIPADLRVSSMGTYGIYSSYYFNECGADIFSEYEDGLACDEWIEKNKCWLDAISTDTLVQVEIFNAISANDFRSGSCGGCGI